MKIILGLYIILYCAQLSNAAHFRPHTYIKRSLSVRTVSGAKSGRSLNLVPRNKHNRVATTWFASWHAADFPLSAVSWEKYDVIMYAFA
jgi:hypothetical protein